MLCRLASKGDTGVDAVVKGRCSEGTPSRGRKVAIILEGRAAQTAARRSLSLVSKCQGIVTLVSRLWQTITTIFPQKDRCSLIPTFTESWIILQTQCLKLLSWTMVVSKRVVGGDRNDAVHHQTLSTENTLLIRTRHGYILILSV